MLRVNWWEFRIWSLGRVEGHELFEREMAGGWWQDLSLSSTSRPTVPTSNVRTARNETRDSIPAIPS